MNALFIVMIISLFSCENDDNSEVDATIVGSWKLIENLIDPGDGSGTFQMVESNKIISFNENGTITSNGSICDMSINSDNSTSGTYSLTTLTFSSADCTDVTLEYHYQINGSFLTISYLCFEPCISKYSKIE